MAPKFNPCVKLKLLWAILNKGDQFNNTKSQGQVAWERNIMKRLSKICKHSGAHGSSKLVNILATFTEHYLLICNRCDGGSWEDQTFE